MTTHLQPPTHGFRRFRAQRIVHRRAALAVAAAGLLISMARVVQAQPVAGGMALNQLDPAPAGDAFFGVPSPWVEGHLVPRAFVMFDHASRPLIREESSIVAMQAFLRLDASFALWNRLLLSVDVPLAVVQGGKQPAAPDIDFHPPSSAAFGDVRAGVRLRLFGENGSPFQVGVEGNVYAPTGPAGSYTGDGSVRGAFNALAGGRFDAGIPVLWSLSGGAMLRTSENPHTFTFGAAMAALFWKERVQVGAELFGAAWIGDRGPLSTSTRDLGGNTNAELQLGTKVRIVEGLVLGAAVGMGLTPAIGSPEIRGIGMVAWAPALGPNRSGPRAAVRDSDGDGFNDDVDACPQVKGELSSDPKKDGCPPADGDGDLVTDLEDACPRLAGVRRADATRNGCPDDTDGDGVYDPLDACLQTKGGESSDPDTNGCPADRDGDDISDPDDACPDAKGVHSSVARWNGCPADADGDGIQIASDACPDEKGSPNADPAENGCPAVARLTSDREIRMRKQIQFKLYGKHRSETIEYIPDDVLKEVNSLLLQHPEIVKIEVQGHADDSGTEAFNLNLSQERADAVRKWLIAAGVPAAKLVAKGHGFETPVADNRIVTGRRKNRRVVLMILETKP